MIRAHNEYLFIEYIKDGYFEIDNDGRMWRLAIRKGRNNFAKIHRRKFGYKDGRGYIQVAISKKGKWYNCLAHRVVWIYFNGEIPDGLEINHKDGIKINNRLENLELVTRSENHKHAFRI